MDDEKDWKGEKTENTKAVMSLRSPKGLTPAEPGDLRRLAQRVKLFASGGFQDLRYQFPLGQTRHVSILTFARTVFRHD